MKLETVVGVHAIRHLVFKAPERLQSFYILQGTSNQRALKLLEQIQEANIEVVKCEKQTFKQLIGESRNHQGVAATITNKQQPNKKDMQGYLQGLSPHSTILILDGVQDPRNLGACLRTADAAGVDAVILPKNKAVSINPTVTKVASGAVENLVIFEVANLAQALELLKKEHFWIVGTDGDTDKTIYDKEVQSLLTGRVACVFGAEGSGLRRLTRENCDVLAAIPMLGCVESLNVSVATGIMLYEIISKSMA